LGAEHPILFVRKLFLQIGFFSGSHLMEDQSLEGRVGRRKGRLAKSRGPCEKK
jgi:hypothetical protein